MCVHYLLGVPTLPPAQDKMDRDPGGSSGNPLRDFMLKSPGEQQRRQVGPPSEPRSDCEELPKFPGSPFHGWTPFSKVNIILTLRSEFRCAGVFKVSLLLGC